MPFDRKMELVARLEAGERAADLAAEAGVTAAAVSGWRRRLREEGALSLMTDSDIAARAPEPREAPSELEELRARCEELELRNAVLPPMYFPPFTPMIHNRSRQPAPAGYANVFPPLSAPPSNLSRNARASRARALSEPG